MYSYLPELILCDFLMSPKTNIYSTYYFESQDVHDTKEISFWKVYQTLLLGMVYI